MRLTTSLALILMALILLPASSFATGSPSAYRIMEQVDARDDGDHRTSDMTMVLLDEHGGKRVRVLRTFYRDFGKALQDTYKLLFFLSPAEVEDTAFLSYDYDGERDDDQWLYLPALRKTKRIASDDKSSAFMGSDFSYADMTKRELANYQYALLGEQELRGCRVWLVQATPRTPQIVKKYGYAKSVLFVRQDNHVTVRAVHWEDKPNRLKYYDVKRLEKIDGIWTPLEVHMTSRYGKRFLHKTILTYDNVRYNQELAEGVFSVRTMERGL